MKFFVAIAGLLLVKAATADNTVIPSKTCFLARENFVVSFTDSSPAFGDAVEIVAAGTTRALLSTSTCSSFFCFFSPPRSGTVTIAERLAAGNYQAVFKKGSNFFSSGSITATSATFRLLGSGQACSPSTPQPTHSPTPKPTPSPTLPPSPPTPATTTPPTPASINDLANQAMTQARSVIASMVQADPRLTPEFIRMGFHDCIHVCDGCIDMTVADNNGLAHPISVLAPVVAQFENAAINVSRADIWALASMVGADVAPHGTTTQPISFTQNWFGRVNCENANTVCTNAQGAAVPCSATVGPARNMPSVNFDGPSLFKYFSTEFNLTQRQVVALMGAHNVGHLVQTESGVNGPNGWEVNNKILQNEYYQALMGAAVPPTTPIADMVFNSPTWVRVVDNNAGTSFPNINRWALTAAGLPLVMLDPDIALVRDLNSGNTNPTTGFVSCAFNNHSESGVAACGASSTITIAAEFSSSNDLWLSEFKAAMDLMLTNGYNRVSCTKAMCQLILK